MPKATLLDLYVELILTLQYSDKSRLALSVRKWMAIMLNFYYSQEIVLGRKVHIWS